MREHAAEQRYTFVGPVLVRLAHDAELPLGHLPGESAVGSAPGLAGPGAGRKPPSGGSQEINGRPRLVLTSGGSVRAGTAEASGAENEYALDKELVVIGRGSEADLRLADTGVSRRHGEIREVGGRRPRLPRPRLDQRQQGERQGLDAGPSDPAARRRPHRTREELARVPQGRDTAQRAGRQGGEGSGASDEA